MLSYFLGAVALLFVVALALGYLAKADPKVLATMIRKVAGSALIVLALVLAARGLFIYAVPLGFLGYSLLRGGAVFSSPFPGSANKTAGQQSRVRTETIEMRLDHDTGTMEGMVLKGAFANRMLAELNRGELLELLDDCLRHDPQAAQLLQAWLDREHPDWREAAGRAQEEPSHGRGGGAMTPDQAYEVLGLQPGASESEIRKAHRTLMKKLHPDQGGSNYLAARINEAKDLLLGGAK